METSIGVQLGVTQRAAFFVAGLHSVHAVAFCAIETPHFVGIVSKAVGEGKVGAGIVELRIDTRGQPPQEQGRVLLEARFEVGSPGGFRLTGSYARLLARIARTDVFVLDDLGLVPIREPERRHLLEIMDDRHGSRSTIRSDHDQPE